MSIFEFVVNLVLKLHTLFTLQKKSGLNKIKVIII